MHDRVKQTVSIVFLYVPTSVIIVIDQFTKHLASSYLDWIPDKILPFFSLTLACNTGAAFSMFKGAGGILLWIGIAFSLFFVYQIYRSRNGRLVEFAGYSCILAGAVGNVIDRLTRGCVIDFLHFHAGSPGEFGGYPYNFPIFNVADTAITVGFILIIWVLFTNARREKPELE
ncbi:MAG: signal peptidase II [Gammaproteobacteria bacterium]|nr:signal peptidase II [Gammaproteobacteria bacterium]MDE0094216.1 signal peptidase II [Gammaproteobacteria bacterium]MDE0251746.1 signal peptidase II [Gammaproteobacteria bacterium]MDE0403244.1 signal peptidase II [Gammaproteobacteria bacterium]